MSYRDADFLARHAYGLGIDPVSYAERSVTMILDVHDMVTVSRAAEPATFPGYCLEMTTAAVASRIVGAFLEAGWTPPEVPGAKDEITGEAS
jgi:hypothetical protein